MKRITLHSPALRNSGAYADAGETLAIGDHPDEISAERAGGLTDAARAAIESVASRGDPQSGMSA